MQTALSKMIRLTLLFGIESEIGDFYICKKIDINVHKHQCILKVLVGRSFWDNSVGITCLF